MRKPWVNSPKIVLALLIAALLIAALPAMASADPTVSFSAAITDLHNTDPGKIKVKPEDGLITVKTEGEKNTATLDCGSPAANPVCHALGLQGATLNEEHNSKVVLSPTATPGVFSLSGELKGKFTITSASGQPVTKGQGKVREAKLSGTAQCYPDAANCQTFAINVTDTGEWGAKVNATQPLKAQGSLNLTVAGIVGVFLTGGGTLSGTLD